MESPSSPPNPDAGSSSADYQASFSSGIDATGLSNGMIGWSGGSASSAVSLDSLALPGVAADPAQNFLLPGTEYYRSGTRLQYLYGSQLVDAQSVNDTLTLRFYQTQNLGEKVSGFYNPPASDLTKTVSYTKTGEAVAVTKSEGGATTNTHLMEWDSALGSSSWTDLIKGQKFVTIRGLNGSNPVVTHEEWSAGSSATYTLISRVSREYEQPATGNLRLIKTTRDPIWTGRTNPANLAENLQYGADGKIARTTRTDGSWNIETTGGDVNFPLPAGATEHSVSYSPWLDAACPATGLPALADCVARVSWKKESTTEEGITTITTTTQTHTKGVLTAMEESIASFDGYDTVVTKTYNKNGQYVSTKRRSYPASYSPDPGKLYQTTDESGRTTTYGYEKMSLNPVNLQFQTDPTGTFNATYATEGTTASVDGVLDADGNTLTTRTLTIADGDGHTARTEIQAYNGTTYETMSVTEYVRTYNTINDRLESIATFRDSRQISLEEILSNNERRYTDEQGVVETITTDSEGRTVASTRASVTTTYNYAPLTTTITQSASGLPDRITSSVTNLLGETISSTDESGTLTTYTRDYANRTETTIRNGVTTITSRYIDGQSKSVSGTGTIASYSTYEVDTSNGFITTTTSQGQSGSHSARWQKNTVDWAGRTRSTTRPGTPIYGGGRNADMVVNYHYDETTGRLIKTQGNAGPSPILHLSDALGATTTYGLDINDDGDLDKAENDRPITSQTYYRKDTDGWWQVTDSTRWISTSDSEFTKSERLMSATLGENYRSTPFVGATPRTVSRSYDPANKSITTATAGPEGAHSSTETLNSDGTRLVETTVPDISAPSTSTQAGREIHLYDPYGRLIRHTDPRGATTTTLHYGAGYQLDRVTDQLGHSTHYTYYGPAHANAGLLEKVTDHGGGITQYFYNTRGQTSEITGNATYRQTFTYDSYGAMETLTTYGTIQATTTWHNDPATGLLTFKEYNGGKGTRYGYTPDGRIAARVWQRGITTTYDYAPGTRDLTGVSYSDSDTPDVTFTNHDFLGRPTTVTESRNGGVNDVTTLSYDPVSGAEDTTYDTNHSLLPEITLEAHGPDAYGNPTGHAAKQGGSPLHQWSFLNDAFGRIQSLASGSLGVEFQAQPGTRQIRDQITKNNNSTIHHSTRGIDMLGRVTGMVSRAPNGGILASAGHLYDDRHRRENTRREDGTLWEYGYNDRSEVTSAVKKTAATALVPGLSFGYVYDGMGNRITSTAGTAPNVAETSYARDALNQYTSITTPGKADILVRSDNPVTMTVAGTAVTPTSTGNLYNAHATISNNSGRYYEVVVTSGNSTQSGHRWLRPSTVAPMTPYDDDGNLTQDGRWSYHWDAENRLIKLQTRTSAIAAGAPALTLEYAYDWRGRRIGAKTTLGANITSDIRTLYDQWNPVATFSHQDSTLAIQHTLLWGPDLSGSHQGAGGVGGLICITDVSNSQTYLPSYDTNGNIIAWSDLTGQLIRRLDYDPFGNVILKETFAGDSSDLDKILTHGFSTKPADPDSGLLYYGYRWYDPMTGRWPSRDPIEEEGGLNLYGFVGNDGVNQWDYLGLLDSTEALSHFKGGTATAKRMSFDDIDTSNVKPSEFPRVKDAIRDFKKKPKPARTVKIKWTNKNDNLAFTTSGDQALFLGDISLKLEGDFVIKNDCTWEFKGPLKSFDDWYDFNASTHRGLLGELLTTAGRNTPGKPYWIEIRGQKQLTETGSMSSHQDLGGGGGRGWY